MSVGRAFALGPAFQRHGFQDQQRRWVDFERSVHLLEAMNQVMVQCISAVVHELENATIIWVL
ncbi:MAG: hypothetical protein KatS3mg059_0190 [Thermomicrobiales bacterium]|nr:MAG: hypothetical protein KatS3mg059_0190 [Thermomicrobiales bacterium]